jgi:alpha-tubulin suppressor-like RCC1 family protein
MAALALAAALALGYGGCVGPRDGFSCSAHGQCVDGAGRQGMCEDVGQCSFFDASCTDSYRRFADAARADLAGSCVQAASAAGCVAQVVAGGNPGEAEEPAYSHTCALKNDGTVFCWGANNVGQLGHGGGATPIPRKVAGLPAVQAISAGALHTCALAADGRVFCWGSNGDAQLGAVDAGGVKIADTGTPVEVLGLPGPAEMISAAGKHTCALVSGALWCWGENATGELGDGTTEERPTPVEALGMSDVAFVANGDEHTCALTQSRSLWCWGANADGQLGTPEVNGNQLTPAPVGTITSVAEVASGDEHTCARKPDRTIWCWGYNASGEVGDGTTDDARAPVKVLSADHLASSGNAFHTCAFSDEDGELRCWGANENGQVGNGSTGDAVTSPALAHLVAVTQVAVGMAHTCALTRDGALYCWGANESGQLGLGAPGSESAEPVSVALCP